MEYMGNYTWTNGKGKTCRIENGRFYGYNGERAAYTPSYAKNLVLAVAVSDDENALDVLNAMKDTIPFINASYNSAFYETLRKAIKSVTIERCYQNSAWERITKVLRAIPRYSHGSEQNTAMTYKSTIDAMLKITDETHIVQFINQFVVNDNGFNLQNLNSFLQLRQLKQYLPGGQLNVSKNAFTYIIHLTGNFPQYVQSIATLIRNGSLQVCVELDATEIINDLFHYAKLIGIENPNVNGNLLQKSYSLKKEWEAKQDTIFKSVVEQLRDKLEYRAYGLHVTIPTCEADFIREGEQQHNCVGRYGYYDKMSEGKTIVVFIREDSNSDKSFITCEINPKSGRIEQFYKAYNLTALNDRQARLFRNDYETFLIQQFGN